MSGWRKRNLRITSLKSKSINHLDRSVFLANGLEIHFVDVGIAHKREVFGFFTREDLENLPYIRQNGKPRPAGHTPGTFEIVPKGRLKTRFFKVNLYLSP